jgi:hypothetical protein
MSSACAIYSVCTRADWAAHDALQNRDRTKLSAPPLEACGGPGSAAHRFALPAPADRGRAGVCARAAPHPRHGPRYASAYEVGVSLEARRLAKTGRLRPMIDAQVVLNGLVLGGLYACVAVGF